MYPKMFGKVLSKINVRISTAVGSLNTIAKQIGVVVLTLTLLFWTSVFIYGSFYFYYVPVVAQEKNVYFQFRTCENGIGICSFPRANISLLKEGKNEVFKVGQVYKIVLDLDVPESHNNRNIGMFMIEMRLHNKRGELMQTSARATSLQYKSKLLRILETFAFSSFFLFGYMNQKQYLHVELFPDFTDNAYNPSVDIVIEVQSMKVDIYSAKLKIFAEFSGIRYILYYWPVTSAIVGICWNFLWLSFVVLLSWYHFWFSHTPDNGVTPVRINMYKNMKQPSPKKSIKVKSSTSDPPTRVIETVGDPTEDTDRLDISPRLDHGLRLRESHTHKHT